ncbi:MAG: hypothetical protein U1F54_19500 [Burkholderiales bacterium]
MIRPRPARWFEILAARDDATLVLGALGATGAVELEARPAAHLPDEFAELEPLIAQFIELGSRYRAYWPQSRERCSPFPERPSLTLARCLSAIRAWAGAAEPLIARLQRLDTERAELALWSRVLQAIDDPSIDFSNLRSNGPVLHKGLFTFPAGSNVELPRDALARTVDAEGARCVLVVGTEAHVAAIAQQCAGEKGSAHGVPPWFRGNAAEVLAAIASRREANDRERTEAVAELETIHERHDLLTALGDAHRLQWVMRHVRALESDELFCWITGWTSDFRDASLSAAVHASGARALVHFPAPPKDMRPPLLLFNPWWARPFEIFSRAIGMPSRNEADPSALLAIAVPLMFGYMFGDVGQGAVLAIGGALLAKRYPIARLFVAGGLSAIAFGILFGSVFSMHGVIAPRWIDPLDDPLAILVVPLYGGAALMTLGLALAAFEYRWRGEFAHWLLTDAGLVLAYGGLMASFLDSRALVVAAAGAVWFCCGHGIASRSAAGGLASAGELVERVLQLGINTLSFSRVGAFALAHAGLSAAIVALVHAAGHPAVAALVLVLGNVVVIVLETLVVSIQTTRLVLFEFFTRFLAGEGRAFHPLPTPSALAQEVA